MAEIGFQIFDTAIGSCAIAWGERGIVGVALPEVDAQKTQARLLRRHPSARPASPSPQIAGAVTDIVALLAGQPRDLAHVALDMSAVPEFNRRVYAMARTIRPGETSTYGDIAAQLGDKLLARDVGQALGQNPFPIVVPCHRVLAARGKTGSVNAGGFSAPGGVATKLRMLSIERVRLGMPTLFEDLPLVARKR